jgi:hypothetical protein
MSAMNPPSLATWLLEHFVPVPRNEALAGDLLEEFRSGRPASWYWRQTLAALALAWSKSITLRAPAILFSLLQTALVPAWLLVISAVENHFSLHQRFHQMDWPWPFLCEWGVLLSANLPFIWTGIALYLICHLIASKTFSLPRFASGMRASFPALVTLWAALVILPANFIQRYGLDNSVSALHSIVSIHLAAFYVRLPFFLTILFTLWMAASHQREPLKSTTTNDLSS